MDLSTDLQAEPAHIIHHTILDQVSETIADTQATVTTCRTDKTTTETTIEIEGTSKTCGMTKETMAIKTSMTIIMIEMHLQCTSGSRLHR